MVRAGVDIHAHRDFAAVTALLIGVIVALGVRALLLSDEQGQFLQDHGAVPQKILALLDWRHPYRSLSALQAIVVGILLHATWVHLAVDVVLLLLFGASVEDRLGHYRFLLLFFVAGIVAALTQCLLDPESRLALVGAHGATSGVAGAWVVLSPRGRVPTMVRGLEIPWVFGPVLWALGEVLTVSSAWALPAGVGTAGFPAVLLAFGVGLALGPFYRSSRPILLRG